MNPSQRMMQPTLPTLACCIAEGWTGIRRQTEPWKHLRWQRKQGGMQLVYTGSDESRRGQVIVPHYSLIINP